MSVPNGTPIYRIESRLVIPTLRVPNPSEEQWDGQAITETLLNKKFESKDEVMDFLEKCKSSVFTIRAIEKSVSEKIDSHIKENARIEK